MKYEFKVFDAPSRSMWSGTFKDALDCFLNDPKNFEDGWEFVQVIETYTGGAYVLMRREK